MFEWSMNFFGRRLDVRRAQRAAAAALATSAPTSPRTSSTPPVPVASARWSPGCGSCSLARDAHPAAAEEVPLLPLEHRRVSRTRPAAASGSRRTAAVPRTWTRRCSSGSNGTSSAAAAARSRATHIQPLLKKFRCSHSNIAGSTYAALRPFGESHMLPRAAYVDPAVLALGERELLRRPLDLRRSQRRPDQARQPEGGPSRPPGQRAVDPRRGRGTARFRQRLPPPRARVAALRLHRRPSPLGWSYVPITRGPTSWLATCAPRGASRRCAASSSVRCGACRASKTTEPSKL